MTQPYWTIGYAPFTRVLPVEVFERKPQAEARARQINSTPGEYKGRGCRAYKCDARGNLVR